MSDDAYGATVAKRRLARRLSDLRRASGYTANNVCDLLDWGRGKVGRFEANHWRRPEMSDIRDLMRVYGVEGEARDEIEELAMRARVRPWWRDYSDVYENEFPGFENDATRIRVFMPLLLPGLLQTLDYTEAVTRVGTRSPMFRRRMAETRQVRQQILSRTDNTPELIAVITEASLMYRWGAREERREQIEHLCELARKKNVRLHIQRFADGPPAGMHSMVNIFDLPEGEPSIVFIETDYAIEEVTSPEAVSNYVDSFARACDAALEPGNTIAYLMQLAEQLE
jgi:transcriptional regulator with XRE-family HTH domain